MVIEVRPPARTTVLLSVLSYSLCSGGMILVNKLAVHFIPLPSYVSVAQLIFCVLVLHVAALLGMVQLDKLVWAKVKPYLVYNLAFAGSLYANMRALQDSNVDTVIVFRSCSPVVVCVLDWIFLGRTLPSLRSTAALALIAVGSVGYVQVDSSFALLGWAAYTWCLAYLALLCFLMCFGKQIVATVEMTGGTSGHVYYTNLLSIPIMLAVALLNSEHELFPTVELSLGGVVFVGLSCVVGVAISWTGWHCRSVLSATAYTIVGVMCKLLPVAVNTAMWSKHASAAGVAFLLLSLAGGTVYQQAPLRREVVRAQMHHAHGSDICDEGPDKA
eukprot:RCo000814